MKSTRDEERSGGKCDYMHKLTTHVDDLSSSSVAVVITALVMFINGGSADFHRGSCYDQLEYERMISAILSS